MADKKNKKPASLGCLFWIAFLLLIIIVFFVKKNTIYDVIERTGLTKLFSSTKQATGLTDTTPETVVPQIKTMDKPSAEPVTGDGSKETEPAPAPVTEKPASKPVAKTTPAPETKQTVKTPAAKTPAVKTETVKQVPTRKSTLFFVTIDADGQVLRKEVTREIPQSDSPLSDTLTALFKGTSSAESGKGLRSLIPQGTRLLSATVKDGNAVLNLSEEFQFNQFGIEGYLGQLAQIVFTATAFPTVKSVQFLIEGQRHEYLGAEGVWIGTPLSRDKF